MVAIVIKYVNNLKELFKFPRPHPARVKLIVDADVSAVADGVEAGAGASAEARDGAGASAEARYGAGTSAGTSTDTSANAYKSFSFCKFVSLQVVRSFYKYVIFGHVDIFYLKMFLILDSTF